MSKDSLQPKTGLLGRAAPGWLFPSSTSEALIRTGWGCWLTLILVVSIMAVVKGGDRSVVWYYHAASASWWAGQNLYSGQVDSFNYLPAFAVLFTPFHLMGPLLAGLLWRWLSFAALTAGFWRLARMIAA